MEKKNRYFVLLMVALGCIVLGIGAALGLMGINGEINNGKAFNFHDLFLITLFFSLAFILVSNTLFSHLYLTGRAQELLFFISNTLLMGLLFGYVIYSIFKCQFDFTKITWYEYFKSIVKGDLLYYGISFLVWFLLVLFYCTVIDRKMFGFLTGRPGMGDGKLNQVEANLENSRWLTKDEINKLFKPTVYSKLNTVKKDGIPVIGKLIKNGKDMEVAFNSPCHSIIIGSTGSGKTTTFVSPMIQLLASTAAGSSMVITDPKGELFSLHSKYLCERGYDVKVVDLRDTYSSYRWNPLDSIWNNYQNYLNANKNVFLRRDKASESGLKLTDDAIAYDSIQEYYEFEGKAYIERSKLIEAIKVYRKKTFDEVYEDLNDLCSVLIPVENDKDPMWEKGARSIVFAVLLAMLEDSEDEKLGMTKDKFNFFNMTKILQNSQEDYKELRNYFRGRKQLSRALSLSKQVCDAATQTRASYMSIVYEKLTMFNDAGICALTSASDFTATGLAERPTALFLKIPDEKDTRHNLAAIFILNIYKTLIKVASATEELTLPRNVYFIMDEFGNMPKIEKFDKFITVGRSRKIWFNMIVQSYAQLNNVYGETVADIVKGNCGIKMFIGSNDAGTCKEYSELCGNITVMTRSSSFQNRGSDAGSTSTQTQVRPLIYPSELQRLNHPGDIGHSIIVTFGNYPLKTYFSPSFKVPFYKIGKMDTSDTERYFDENAIAYFASKRNELVFQSMEQQTEKSKEAELKMGTVNGAPVNQAAEASVVAAEAQGEEAEEKPSENQAEEAPKQEDAKQGEEQKEVNPEVSAIEKAYEGYMKTHANASLSDFYMFMAEKASTKPISKNAPQARDAVEKKTTKKTTSTKPVAKKPTTKSSTAKKTTKKESSENNEESK